MNVFNSIAVDLEQLGFILWQNSTEFISSLIISNIFEPQGALGTEKQQDARSACGVPALQPRNSFVVMRTRGVNMQNSNSSILVSAKRICFPD